MHQMVGARLEDRTKWLQMASAQESDNQMAIGGSRRPTEKIAAWQLTGHAGQKKIVARQSGYCAGQRNKCGAAIDGLHRPKEKITARQSMDCAGQKKKKNCSAAIGVLRWPLQKIAARQSGYCACLFKNGHTAIRVLCLPL